MAETAGRLPIVDDDQGVTSVIEQTALQIGFEALAIHDSDQFEKALQQFIPTIIFFDITMPGPDGMKLIGHLAAGHYPGKVVIMSTDLAKIQMSASIAKGRGLMVSWHADEAIQSRQSWIC